MRSRSLRLRLLLAFLALAILPLLLAGAVLAWESYRLYVVELQERQHDLAERLAVELESFFRGIEDRIAMLDMIEDFSRLDAAEQRRRLAILVSERRDFRDIAVLDASGRERARVSAVEPVFAADLKARASDEEFAWPAANGRTYSGPIEFDRETGEPLMTLAVPFVDRASGKTATVVVAVLRVRHVWDLVGARRLPAGQSLAVLDSRQRVIAHRNPSVVLRGTVLPEPPADGLGTGVTGEPAYVVTRQFQVGQQAFTIMAEYAARQALVPAGRAAAVIALVTLLALLMVLALIWFAIRNIVQPVEAVSRAARAVRDGDLRQRLEVGREDEIGELASSFNAMSAELEAASERQQKAMDEIEDLYNRAPCGYHSLGPDGTFLRMNDTELAWLGYGRDEVVGRLRFVDLVTADSQRIFFHEFPRFKQQGWIRDLEMEMVRKDGSFLPVVVNAMAIKDADGNYVMSRSTVYDNTARRAAEMALRQSEARLAEAQRIAHLGYWEWDVAGGRQYWSDESFRIYGYEPGSVEPTYDLLIALVPPEERGRLEAALAEAVAQNRYYQCDYRIRRHDGEERYVHTQAEVVRDAAGRAERMVGINLDITERKRAEDQVRELNLHLEQRVAERTAQLEVANKELEAFAYSVSHDLRAPLRAIDGFSHIVVDDYADRLDDEGRRLLKVIRDNTARMGDLIDDILNFSRTSRQSISAVEVDLAKLSEEVFAELLASTPDRSIRFDLKPLPAACGDRVLLRQVLVNLIANAIKFTGGRGDPVIEVGGSQEAEENSYYVKDNGVGFDMHYVDKLFGVFQRLHTTQEFEGTGIGLAIVKRIVTRHGGRVWAEGKVGEGATIHFTLPRQEPCA